MCVLSVFYNSSYDPKNPKQSTILHIAYIVCTL